MGSIKDRVAVHMIGRLKKPAGFTRATSSWKTPRGTPPGVGHGRPPRRIPVEGRGAGSHQPGKNCPARSAWGRKSSKWTAPFLPNPPILTIKSHPGWQPGPPPATSPTSTITAETTKLTTSPRDQRSGSRWRGRIDHLVAGIGTGGTLGGTAQYLKEKDPSIQVIAVDPVGSVYGHYFRTGERCVPSPLSGRGSRGRVHHRLRGFPKRGRGRDRVGPRRLSDMPRTGAPRSRPGGRIQRCGPLATIQLARRLDPSARIMTIFPRRRFALPEQVLQRRVDAGERLSNLDTARRTEAARSLRRRKQFCERAEAFDPDPALTACGPALYFKWGERIRGRGARLPGCAEGEEAHTWP